LTKVVAEAAAAGLMARAGAGRSASVDGDDQPEAGVGTDEPLAEWEKELLVRSDDTPAEPAAATPAPVAE
ncbi:MAG TPA: 30S ribosomal protein S2, partial [Pseudonocardiaceae bacterium]